MSFDSSEYDERDFDDEFLEYARRALELAGIPTDAKLKQTKPVQQSVLHSISEQSFQYTAARKAVPRSGAHWQIANFASVAVRPAIWDLQWGKIKNYAQFDYLFRRIWGEESRPYLPMVFAAAVWSPAIDPALASSLVATMPDREFDELFRD